MAAQAIAFLGLDQGGGPSQPPPTTTPPPDAAACQVGYRGTAWNTGLVAAITITNPGSTAINGWSLAFTLPAGQQLNHAEFVHAQRQRLRARLVTQPSPLGEPVYARPGLPVAPLLRQSST